MRRLAAVFLGAILSASAVPADVSHRVLSFDDLDAWAEDDHAAALATFINTCGDMRDPDWRTLCRIARTGPDPRSFFEILFRPVLVGDGSAGLFTGYYEPELNGSRHRGGPYQYPLYRRPENGEAGAQASREEIEEQELLSSRGLEIAWIDDPVDVFFLQVQGSGRIRLDDGTAIRVGYGGKNGHEYRSVGLELVRRGEFEPHQVSAGTIRDWVEQQGDEGLELLRHNPSYVFFRELRQLPWDRGPLGAMNRSITTLRSIAVDPAYVPLGAPVWIEKDGHNPMRRLMVAQDTGSAIKGAQRADIFYGTGDAAGRRAGAVKDPGRMVLLLPIQRAFALVAGL